MPPIVRLMAERHPQVALHTEDLSITDLVAGVREGRLDGALSRPPLVDDLVWLPLAAEPVVVALPDGHRLRRLTAAVG